MWSAFAGSSAPARQERRTSTKPASASPLNRVAASATMTRLGLLFFSGVEELAMKSKVVEDADVVTYVVVCDPGDEA